jgi:hypothetical protein
MNAGFTHDRKSGKPNSPSRNQNILTALKEKNEITQYTTSLFNVVGRRCTGAEDQ